MRRIWTGVLALALLTLTACGDPAVQEVPEEELEGVCGLVEAPPGRRGWMVDMEREVYDPSLTTFTYFIRNETGETAEFGEDYRLRRWGDGGWADLTPREDWGFSDIGYSLAHCGELALTCTLDRYEEPPEAGRYQLVKPLGSTTAHVEFRLGRSPYTAETPYGFAPLESLPENYRAYTASEDCLIFTDESVRNPENAEAFVHKTGLGVPCQLRTVEERGGGAPVVTDVVYENGSFLRRVRRDGVIEEQRFSYLVTDGRGLYLSNGADWASGEKYHDGRALLVPAETPGEMIDAVEAATSARLEGNVIRYQSWSHDGVRSVGLTDTPTEFSVSWQKPGEGSRGSTYDLQNWDGLETSIQKIEWQEDGTLALSCGTPDGGSSRLRFDPETERLTGLELCVLPPAADADGPQRRS